MAFSLQRSLRLGGSTLLSVAAACGPLEPDGLDDGADGAAAADQVTASAYRAGAEDFGIVVPGSRRCMEVAGNSNANGAAIQQSDCTYAPNQLWRFTPVGSGGQGVYVITSRRSGLALDVTSVSTRAGAALQQWGYGGGANQQFRVIDLGDGTVQLQALHSGLCVSVEAARGPARNGLRFRQYACADTPRQKLQIVRRGALFRRALVVLMENEGYRDGLPANPAADLPIGLRFECRGWSVDLGLDSSASDAVDAVRNAFPPPPAACLNPANWTVSTRTERITAADALQGLTDFTAEEVGRATIYSLVPAGTYDTIRILEDGDFTLARFRAELDALARTHIIDVHVLAHGSESGFGPGTSPAIQPADLPHLREIVGLTLRTVYQQNCFGRSMNAGWRAAGAKAVSGSVGINYMPVSYATFLRDWATGSTFAYAVQHAYDIAAPAHRTYFRYVDLYDESNTGANGVPAQRDPAQIDIGGGLDNADEMDASAMPVDGTGSTRVR